MLRRDVLKAILAAAAAPSVAWADQPGLELGDAAPFDPQMIHDRARAMAQAPYQARPQFPEPWRDLSYDQYRTLSFDGRKALWRGSETPQRVDVFPPGLYFMDGIEIFEIDAGMARPLRFDLGVFDTSNISTDLPVNDALGYTGLRLRAELEHPGIYQEYAVFQGASYFRGIGTGQFYGLSARGLALKTGDPMGEEFPNFIAFWIEKPAPGQKTVILHALLDSPSCTGAYRFAITPGETLVMQVEAELFARTDMPHMGIAPLTSMFLFDDMDRHRFDDFRPAVHDSNGLLIHNGAGETIWRPLANPKTLQISAFSDTNPKGFGLCQRARSFEDFNDLEAHYHERPMLWVTPGEGWGPGAVTLVEIPADQEIYDNIVAYWRPSEGIKAGDSHAMSYRLDWGIDTAPGANELLRVVNTASGGRPEGGRIFAIDFAPGDAVPDDLSTISKVIHASQGEVSAGVIQRNPATGGPRLAFTFYPGDARFAEFRVQLYTDDRPLSELWLYRWTIS